MAKQYSDTLRNTWIASIESTLGTTPLTRIYTGSQPATVGTTASGTLLWQRGYGLDAAGLLWF